MQRSWAYQFYDAGLIAVLLLPLGLVSALLAARDHAAAIYALVLAIAETPAPSLNSS